MQTSVATAESGPAPPPAAPPPGWRLRGKMMLPVLAGAALVAVAATRAIDRMGDEVVAETARVAIRSAGRTFEDELAASAEALSALMGVVARDRELTAAVAAHDPRAILAVAGPTFRELAARRALTHWNYWEPEPPGQGRGPLRNLVRLGTPWMRGELSARVTLDRVIHEKALVTGLELGYTGFALRALAPVRDGGRIVAYAELGRDLASFLAEMKGRTGDDYGLLLDKRHMEARRWASARAARGERNDWGDLPEVVLAKSTGRGERLFSDVFRPGDLPDEGRVLGLIRENGHAFARGAFPVRDAGGQKVGAVVAVRDVSVLVAEVAAARRRANRTVGALLAALVLGVALAFEVLVIRDAGASRRAPPPR